MKVRLLWIVCVLAICAFPLGAQTTLTMIDGWNGPTVTAQAQNITTNSLLLSKQLNYNQSWDTTLPANGNTLIKIWFNDGTTSLAQTPLAVVNVKTAKLEDSGGYMILTLTPVSGLGHKVDEANAFLNSKVPTKEFCLGGKVADYLGKRGFILANGMVVILTGNLSVVPDNGKAACLCGRGLAPGAAGDIELFEVKGRCDIAPPPKKK
jgi:hypothetical protein